ncbi:FHA domain-containing protein [Microbacterium sp.]|uniref:FHA domain-containing protein n=1 Tax=Microbacterium sp. TaxID=51671 RepID=UPI003F728FD3
MQTTYRSGQWYVIVLPGALVALPPGTSSDVVMSLWERMPQHRTLATVVDVIAAQAGGAFGSMPSFVAAVSEGADLRMALRGAVSARVTAAAGEQEFSGSDVTTWSERFVAGASRIEITVEATDASDDLPVHSGVVRAGVVSARFEPADATAGEPEPQASAAPVPEPEAPAAPVSAPTAPEPMSPAPLAAPPADREPAPAPVVDDVVTPDEATLAHGAVVDDGMTPNEATLAPAIEDFDQLWGATVHSAPAEPAPIPPAPPVPDLGDHDGETISAAALRALRHEPPLEAPAPPPTPPAPGATGRIRVSTGQVVTLDRTVIIGRRPRSTRASGANLPHLIAVDSPQQDISRSHLEIRPEGDTVVVIDLHTTNGSTLLRPGADPMRLHPGEQTLVLSGDVVDLGDGVEVAFEDLP